MGKKHFCFFQTAKTGNRTPNSGVKGSGANHYPRAPAHRQTRQPQKHETLTQCWALICWLTVYDADPTLAQHIVNVSCLTPALNVGQRHRQRASINSASDQSIVLVMLCYASPTLTRQCVGVTRCNVPLSTTLGNI